VICNLNCGECKWASEEKSDGKGIVVAVAGSAVDSAYLDFSSSPIRKILFKGYTIRFINFSGNTCHVGRSILASKPDVVLNTVDSTDLENSMELTSRLVDMDCHVALAFVGYDRLFSTGHSLDTEKLSELLGFRSIALGEYSDESLSRLLSLIVDVYETPLSLHRHTHVPYGTDADKAIDEITAVIAKSDSLVSKYHDRYLAVRLIEDPEYIIERIESDSYGPEIERVAAEKVAALERQYKIPARDLVQGAREGFIHGALQETLHHSSDNRDHSLLQKVDSVLTGKYFGFPILIAVLLVIFKCTFTLGAYPQKLIEDGVDLLSASLKSSLPPGWLPSLVADGILQGVGAVISFLPNIVILFLFLSVLEDSGYMARAAFLMDKIMHKVGLHGRSFVPMVIGFGCNVPAIMAARSIEDRRDRTLTMLMIPFMSCSARLPVYMLIVSAFMPDYQALVMIGIYLFGVVLSILFALVMKKTRFFRKQDGDYVSELPPFRDPTWRTVLRHLWERTADYLKKISTVILAASVIIWALEYFPADRTHNGENKEESCLAMIGKEMEPVFSPLGFDWKLDVCLLTGLPAKEAIVSTMGILYHSNEGTSVAQTMRKEGAMTLPVALSFMVFVLLYFPCLATIGALRKETGWKWAVFTVVHSLLLAWVVAFLVFRVSLLL